MKTTIFVAALFAVLLVGLSWPQVAFAQVCEAQDADIFDASRRTRAIVASYEQFHARHRADLARNEAFAEATEQELPWRFDLAGNAGVAQTFGFDVCSNRGPWEAKLMPMELAALASIDLYRLGVGVEVFTLQIVHKLVASPTLEQTRDEEGNYVEPTGLAHVSTSEWVYGARLTLHRFGSVVAGRIQSRPVVETAGVDGRRLEVPATATRSDARYYLGAATPFGHGLLHLVFEPHDVATDVVGLRFDRVPLPTQALAGVVGASWIRDERRGVLDLGVSEVFDVFSFVTSTEMVPVRLRSVVARADLLGGPEKILRSVDPETQKEAAMRLALDLGLFAQLSYFNSAHLQAQTGHRNLWGGAAGVTARPDLTILMAQFDLWFGVNQPDELARISQFANHWQMGLRVHGRFGL